GENRSLAASGRSFTDTFGPYQAHVYILGDAGDVGVSPPGTPPPPAGVVAAVLPSSRSVQVGRPATAFATMINAGSTPATGCRISWPSNLPGTFMFQTTASATNALVGTANQPVDIPPGGAQSFLFAFTPSAPFPPTEVTPAFACASGTPAPRTPGVNTILLSASATPVADAVALGATVNNDGIVDAAPAGGAFAVASVNVGVGATLSISADTGGAALPLNVMVCRTETATGACLGSPAPTSSLMLDGGTTASFGVFVQALGPVPFDPAGSRVFIRFTDEAGVVRGATSVAVRTP
ncbi:MAG: hypothetical protein ACREM3_30620, partial [Candidatus Rokuibacteriota bacterium]